MAADILSYMSWVCPVWLATGKGRPENTLELTLPSVDSMPGITRWPFSAVFDEMWGSLVERWETGGESPVVPEAWIRAKCGMLRTDVAIVREGLVKIEGAFKVLSEMVRALSLAEAENKALTRISENSKSVAMKPEMERLLDDVRKLTEEPGRKVKLAAELEVEPARVSEWLSGKYQPNGETTLRLLHWVAREKAQQKSPGSVITTARAKAQPGRKKHDNSRPSDSPKR